jgi:hypothetical protein
VSRGVPAREIPIQRWATMTVAAQLLDHRRRRLDAVDWDAAATKRHPLGNQV